eukprot:Skav214323  [mRNA]  locus=scaffold86:110995:133601:+ [translate_table: standard]
MALRIGDAYLEDSLPDLALAAWHMVDAVTLQRYTVASCEWLAAPQRAALMARKAAARSGGSQGLLKKSLEQCESAIDLLRGSGRHQEALSELQALPPEVASMASLGLAHLASENFQAARDTFEDVLDELEEQGPMETEDLDTPLAARRIGTEDGSKCLLALGDVYAELDDFEEDVDDLFEKIEDARLQLRHSDARRLFGDEDDRKACFSMGGGGSKSHVQSIPRSDDETSPRKSMFAMDGLDVSKGLTGRTARRLEADEPRQLVHATERGLDIEDAQGNRKPLPVDAVKWFKQLAPRNRNNEALSGSLAFVPWILQEAYLQGDVYPDTLVLHRGSGAVVFSDASGFTALTERLALKTNGAELLSQCLTSFFTPLIQLINAYRGDVIKFSGDALMIYFPAGVGPGGKIAFPWYDRSLITGDGSGDKSQLAESNVQKLCSLPDWPGICKIQNLLGETHDASLHAQVPYAPPKGSFNPEPLPPNSPLSSGGSVVLQASPCGRLKEKRAELMKLVEERGAHPVSLWTLCKNPDMNLEFASSAKGWYMDLAGLSQDICQEYMASHLEVPLGSIPEQVVSFVYKISLGNPLYIREALGQLLADGHIDVRDGSEVEQNIEEQLDWSHTSMVGETMCLLESLDPLQAAVLKVSTVFASPFSLQDLASSSCSRLIERALNRDLPARMEDLEKKKKEPHIPWNFWQHFRIFQVGFSPGVRVAIKT